MVKRILNKEESIKEPKVTDKSWFRVAKMSGAKGFYVVCVDTDLKREKDLEENSNFNSWLIPRNYY